MKILVTTFQWNVPSNVNSVSQIRVESFCLKPTEFQLNIKLRTRLFVTHHLNEYNSQALIHAWIITMQAFLKLKYKILAQNS